VKKVTRRLPHVKADRIPGIIKVMNLVGDLPDTSPEGGIRPLRTCASNSGTERMLLGNLKESFGRSNHRSGHRAVDLKKGECVWINNDLGPAKCKKMK
jgi:hypothetical protein